MLISTYTPKSAAGGAGERGPRRDSRGVRPDAAGLFEFGDLTAGEVMVPRVRVVGIPLGTSPDEIRGVLGWPPHTRYPIYEGDLDHIIGMVHIKDLLRVLLRDESIRRSTPPIAARAETAPLDSVLSTMRRERTQMVDRARRARGNVRGRHPPGPVRGSRGRDRGRSDSAPQVYRDSSHAFVCPEP